MRTLSKFLLAILLLTVASVGWGACPSGYKNNYKGECVRAPVETIDYGEGHVYKGQLLNGRPHDQGTYTWPNGAKYVGEWKDGNYHGEGTKTYHLIVTCDDELTTNIAVGVALEGSSPEGKWVQITDTLTLEESGSKFLQSLDL